jgi:teichuronic acid biosynthesis glycosyltransferase TuaH
MQNQDKKHIFFLGASRFDSGTHSTSLTIAKQLSSNNAVYYIDYPVTWKDYFSKTQREAIKTRKAKFSFKSDGIINTVLPEFRVVICPPLLSINFLPEGIIYRKLLKLNEAILRRRIKKVLKRFNIHEFIYINSFNFHYPGVADKLSPKLNIYHCVDPMIMPYDMKHGIISENELVKKSDFVVCTSRQLYSEKKALNPETYFIPNAADITHSGKAMNEQLPIHKSLINLKKPIIGYIGAIERRIDYDLLKIVATRNPDKTIVLAGPVYEEYIPDWLRELPNIHMTGSVPYQEMPSLLKGFDIAIIPFKKDRVSSTIFPLKLFEYLGAGKSVVATTFNKDLEEFTSGTVQFCDDETSFSNAIIWELNNDNDLRRQERIKVASENTWEKRSAEFEKIINRHMINRS